jgi:hypothetical protein
MNNGPQEHNGCPHPAYADNVTPLNVTDKKDVELIDVTDLLADQSEPEYLVKDLIEATTTGALVGESTAGKTFAAIDLAYSITTGNTWANKPVMKQGIVIYIAGEGRLGIIRRVNALQDHHKKTIPKGRLFLPRCRVELNQAGARVIACELATLPEPPVLIVIDTVARLLPAGSDENSAKDMMDFINAVDSLRDRFGCVVCLVHHTGHSVEAQGRARGSSAFRAAMDFEIIVNKKKSQITWSKMKDAELPAPVSFDLVQVGNSAVIEYSEKAVQEQTKDRLTKNESLGKETLWNLCKKLNRYIVSIEEWRTEFYRNHTGDSMNSKRSSFNRARTGLVEKGFANVEHDNYSPVKPSEPSVA